MRHIREFDKEIIKKAKTLMLVVPYSVFNQEVISINKTLCSQKPKDVEEFVKFVIDSGIHNLYICVYNIDDTRYKINLADKRITMWNSINLLINTVFDNIYKNYKILKHNPSIQGKYFPTPRGITKVVLKSTMFNDRHGEKVFIDSRIENPLFNPRVKEVIGDKMKDVVCAILTNRDINYKDIDHETDVLNENPFDKALWDVMAYAFIPNDNNATIMV